MKLLCFSVDSFEQNKDIKRVLLFLTFDVGHQLGWLRLL